jgi:hypothetical protein
MQEAQLPTLVEDAAADEGISGARRPVEVGLAERGHLAQRRSAVEHGQGVGDGERLGL